MRPMDRFVPLCLPTLKSGKWRFLEQWLAEVDVAIIVTNDIPGLIERVKLDVRLTLQSATRVVTIPLVGSVESILPTEDPVPPAVRSRGQIATSRL
jgi:hypothetical protein